MKLLRRCKPSRRLIEACDRPPPYRRNRLENPSWQDRPTAGKSFDWLGKRAAAPRSIKQIDRRIVDLNAEIARQNIFLGCERTTLDTLSISVKIGRLGAPAGGPGGAIAPAPNRRRSAPTATRRPVG